MNSYPTLFDRPLRTLQTLKSPTLLLLLLLVALVSSACNLGAAPDGQQELTPETTSSIPATRTPAGTLGVPTTLPLTSIARTQAPGTVPTRIVNIPTAVIPPTNGSQVPVSIVILSPIPGNIVAGNVQVLGSAIHPQFLQYQLEYGPDPNPSNLWFPATGAIQTPVLNNLLGIWNTNAVQDGNYQLRLRVFLRDATSLTTVVNNIRIQNRAPTPQPSATPNVPRPIAAFTVDRWSGQLPLPVRFANQSSGSINSFQWSFGDGSTSSEQHPQHTYNSPGLYTVTLNVTGPGGASNVSGQINVQSPQAPNAGFTMDKTTGTSPLTVQFTDQSTGNVTNHNWNFSDGTGSTERNPSHVFTIPGTYNVFLTVSGPGGSSSTLRVITVQGPTVTPPPTLTSTVAPPPTSTSTHTVPAPANTATATSTATATATTPAQPPTANYGYSQVGGVDRTLLFTDQSTSPATVNGWSWNFGDGGTSNEQNPQHQYAAGGNYDVSLTVTDSNGNTSSPYSAQVTVAEPAQPPNALYAASQVDGVDRTIQFADQSNAPSGTVTGWSWSFGDGGTSNEQNPQHQYTTGGDYTVSLTVTDSNGATSAPYSASVNVVEPVPVLPPLAGFSFGPAGDLTIQFTDTSTSSAGGITGWTWDFGDGSTSNEQNPVHTYGAAGNPTVSLTVTDANGSNSTSQSVEVTAPVVIPDPGSELVQNTPAIPSISGDVQSNLGSIYSNGTSQANRAGVFSVAGDSSAASGAYLDPFNNSGSYALDDSTNGLQGLIDFINSVDLGGVTSFNRPSLATGSGWTVEDLLDPNNRDTGQCNDGESPLACELRVNKPAVVIISVGYQDISDGTNIDDFRSRLQQVVQTATSMGVIPVLTTVQPRPDNAAATAQFNEAIIQVADDLNVPVYNLWVAVNGLPNNGVSGSDLSQGGSVPGDITSGATSQFGANARNRDVLQILDAIRNTIFPGAPAS